MPHFDTPSLDTVAIAPVVLQLNFRNAGVITQREANGVGYNVAAYDGITNLIGTVNLGAENPPRFIPQRNNWWFNVEETSANVPSDPQFNTGFVWHRDVQDKGYVWHPSYGANVQLAEEPKTFMSKPPGVLPSNDDQTDGVDVTPDADRLILLVDAPGPILDTQAAPIQQLLVGTGAAHRFYAREWLTWNGGLISTVQRWRSFVTVRKKADGTWERVGGVGGNFIDLTPANDPETPKFNALDAQMITAP